MSEYDGNWKLVCLCALEFCLKQRSFVDYAIRDYILNNRDKFDEWEKKGMVSMIEQGILAAVYETNPSQNIIIKQDFWKNFQSDLQK